MTFLRAMQRTGGEHGKAWTGAMRHVLSATLALAPAVQAWLAKGGDDGGSEGGCGDASPSLAARLEAVARGAAGAAGAAGGKSAARAGGQGRRAGLAGWLAWRGLSGLAADSAYWIVLGSFSVAGGHVASLHPGARVQCAVEGVGSYAVVLRVGHTMLLVTPDGGTPPQQYPCVPSRQPHVPSPQPHAPRRAAQPAADAA